MYPSNVLSYNHLNGENHHHNLNGNIHNKNALSSGMYNNSQHLTNNVPLKNFDLNNYQNREIHSKSAKNSYSKALNIENDYNYINNEDENEFLEYTQGEITQIEKYHKPNKKRNSESENL